MTPPQDDGFAFSFKEYLIRMSLPNIVGQVNKHMALSLAFESVTVESGPGGGGQFSRDSSLGESDLIIAGRGFLIIMGERKAFRNIFSDEWKEQEITEISASGTADMSMRESENGGIAVMVTRTAVPGFVPCVRTKLDHSERSGCAWICVTMESCPDEGISFGDYSGV